MSSRIKTVDVYLRVTYDNEYAADPTRWDWSGLLNTNDIVVQPIAFTALAEPDPKHFDALTRGLDLESL